METAALKKFAQGARRQLLEQVAARMEQVLRSDSIEIREKAKVVDELREQIKEHGKKAVVDKVAYTWFNRFCALRFMDVNHYTRIGTVSPAEGGTQPEVLLEAKQGHVDDDFARYVDCQVVFDLLHGKRPSSDGQGEAYRLLLVGICNYYGESMPFMFEKIEDYTELLMPLDLLSENSVLYDLREALTPEVCQDVEVIGWLYQYYISERKDEVFEALKQNQKIEAADIPAATQLFTPHWIVRYLVENSLGRLWMLNHPNSRLSEKMEYYIDPSVTARNEAVSSDQEIASSGKERPPRNDTTAASVIASDSEAISSQEEDFLRISSPEELKILDPACGSGHILTYAFDLLYAIYEEEGYASNDIPRLILERNIFGVEIDGRAGALAAFALTMKARAKDRRFFSRDVLTNICVLENVTFNESELKQYMNAVGRDLFTEPLKETLLQFEQAENFGSLIRPILTDAGYVRGVLAKRNVGGDLFLYGVHERVMKVFKFAEFLAPRYHVVITNPPYKGRGELNFSLQEFMEEFFPLSKGDLFACFIERGLDFVSKYGLSAMVTMQAWLFIDTYKDLRIEILEKHSILDLIQIGFNSFPELNSKYALAAAFTIQKDVNGKTGNFMSLNNAPKSADKNIVFFEQKSKSKIFRVNSDSFRYIEGSPISFEASENLRSVFYTAKQLGDIAEPRQGMATGDNDRFVRIWNEVSFNKIGLDFPDQENAHQSQKKWFPYNKGGGFRKWYGNQIYVLAFNKENRDILKTLGNHLPSEGYYFRESITWSLIGLTFGPRYTPRGFLFDVGGSSAFPPSDSMKYLLAFMASKISSECLVSLNPTLNYQVGDIKRLPIKFPDNALVRKEIDKLSQENIDISKEDWDRQEISWGFSKNALLTFNGTELVSIYKAFCEQWRKKFEKTLSNETRLNQLFMETYQLDGEMDQKADLKQVTLLDEVATVEKGYLEISVAAIVKEFISYAVGCMFGRYSLDKPGLVLANQGETLKDYLKQVPKPTFLPDEDNAIPVLEGEWFNDDIAERFKKYLRVTFGEEHYEENLAFLEEAIGRDIRSYFVKEFYKDHVQTYKKRPIYWMFSSPKGSFNVLIYMHRYQPDAVSIVLNGYLREYIKKLNAHKSELERTSVSGSTSQGQKTKALKEIAQVNKILSELKEYEETLFKLASQRLQIDLDDGVKVNYAKFGSALAKIPGL